MTAPGTANLLGISNIPRNTDVGFEVPCAHPFDSQATGEQPVRSGSFADMGAVVLCLVSNWFVNGETILIDGGVSQRALPNSAFRNSHVFYLCRRCWSMPTRSDHPRIGQTFRR